MQNNLKTTLSKILVGSAAVMLTASSLHAIPPTNRDTRDKRKVSCEKPKPGPFAFSFPKDMGLNCPQDFWFEADFLAMQAKEEGLEYAISDTQATLGSFPVTGSVKDFSRDNRDWDWNYGYRFGLGFLLNHDMWSLSAVWTHLNINDHTSTSVDRGSATLIPLWAGPFNTNANNAGTRLKADAKWKAKYNTLDLMLGKPYHVSRYVVLEPQYGLRAAWISQDYRVNYDGMFNNGTPVDNTFMQAKNDFNAVGIRVAVATDFILGAGWDIFGQAGASLLVSKFDISQTNPGSIVGYDIDDTFYTNSANIDMMLGIGWGIFFNENRHHFGIKAAYEFHDWFDQNRLRRFYGTAAAGTIPGDTVSKGDLSLNGISIRAVFDF